MNLKELQFKMKSDTLKEIILTFEEINCIDLKRGKDGVLMSRAIFAYNSALYCSPWTDNQVESIDHYLELEDKIPELVKEMED